MCCAGAQATRTSWLRAALFTCLTYKCCESGHHRHGDLAELSSTHSDVLLYMNQYLLLQEQGNYDPLICHWYPSNLCSQQCCCDAGAAGHPRQRDLAKLSSARSDISSVSSSFHDGRSVAVTDSAMLRTNSETQSATGAARKPSLLGGVPLASQISGTSTGRWAA